MRNNGKALCGNCDELLYLGGNEQSTHKYISELLGKETIDTNTYGKSTGHSGSYSTNYQIAGRELMTPDEVRMLDNQYALLFIRGERPIIDLKYNTFKHTNIKLTEDGGYKPYIHGNTKNAVATISIDTNVSDIKNKEYKDIGKYEFLIDEELEEFLMNESKKDN